MPSQSPSSSLTPPMSVSKNVLLLLVQVLLWLLPQMPHPASSFGFENAGASCASNEYCPGGWSVLRRAEDYSAHTCNPAVKERSKCPKPYMCVAAKCGISFCCASDKMLEKVREKESQERDLASAEREDEEEEERGRRLAHGVEGEGEDKGQKRTEAQTDL